MASVSILGGQQLKNSLIAMAGHKVKPSVISLLFPFEALTHPILPLRFQTKFKLFQDSEGRHPKLVETYHDPWPHSRKVFAH